VPRSRPLPALVAALLCLAVPTLLGVAPAASATVAEPVTVTVSSQRWAGNSGYRLDESADTVATATGGLQSERAGFGVEPGGGGRLAPGRVTFPADGAGDVPAVRLVSGVCTSTSSTLRGGYLDVHEVTYSPSGVVESFAGDMSLDCGAVVATVQARLASGVPHVAVTDSVPVQANTIEGRPTTVTVQFTNRGRTTTRPGAAVASNGTIVEDLCDGQVLEQAESCGVAVAAPASFEVSLPVPELARLEARAQGPEPVRARGVVVGWPAPSPVTGLRAWAAVDGVGVTWDWFRDGTAARVEQLAPSGEWVLLVNGTTDYQYGVAAAPGASVTVRVTPMTPGGLDPAGAATVTATAGDAGFPVGATSYASIDGSGVLDAASVRPGPGEVRVAGRATEPVLRLMVPAGTRPGTYPLADGAGPVGVWWAPDAWTSSQVVTGSVTIARATYGVVDGSAQQLTAVVRGTRRTPQGVVLPVSALVVLNSTPTGLPGYLAADPAEVVTEVPTGIDQTFPVGLRNLGGAPVVVGQARVASTHVEPPQPTAWTVPTTCAGVTVPPSSRCTAVLRVARPELSSPGYPIARATWGTGATSASVRLSGDWNDHSQAPSVTLTAPATVSGAVTAGVSAVDPQGDPVTLRCRLDNGPFTACGPTFVATGLSFGTHTLTAYATDLAGAMSDWRSVTVSSTLPSLRARLSADTRPDLYGRRSGGQLVLHAGNGRSGVGAATVVGDGFHTYTAVVAAGDLTGDGRTDLLGRRQNGDLLVHSGDSAPARRVGTGWQGFTALVGVGDLSGDRRADLLARRSDGSLYLYRGTGSGGFSSGRKVGTGWNAYQTLVALGDFTGDGRVDVGGITTRGELYLHRGNGAGGFVAGRTRIGTGWQGFSAVAATDLSGDGRPDLAARDRAGALYLYRGNGRGGFVTGRTSLGSGWGSYTAVLAAR
jgi:hypothetical protein